MKECDNLKEELEFSLENLEELSDELEQKLPDFYKSFNKIKPT